MSCYEEMTRDRLFRVLYVSVIVVFSAALNRPTSAFTDPLDVSALHDLYGSLNFPPQLTGWKLDGADPCEQSWIGVACSGSSVIYLNLNDLNLNGFLGGQLHNLLSLKQLDISSNSIIGEIPYNLPPNITHLNLAWNKLGQSIPHSISSLKNLRHLNLSHNLLSGPIGDVFSGLQNLKEMDISYNNFIGDLPSSFESLTSLTGLFLQNNQFTGAVSLLANLSLVYLNIQDNHFSGVIPRSFQFIPNLWIGGNSFHAGESPPWNFPLETALGGNISSPPTTQSTALENSPSKRVSGHRKRKLGRGGIACMVGGGTLFATCAALLIVMHVRRRYYHNSQGLISNSSSFHSMSSSPPGEQSPDILPITSLPNLTKRTVPLNFNLGPKKILKRQSFSRKCIPPVEAKAFTIADLQSATSSFSERNLIGEGSLGSVYKAELPDGKILAVKNIHMSSLSPEEENKFLDVICTVYNLKHRNIIGLVGYCIEHGQHILVYEYIRELTLADVLHSGKYKPISWSLRLRIALEVAQAMDYIHSKVSPPIAHGNIKASNILLDDELKPLVSDCGLAVLWPLARCHKKHKASKRAIEESGYTVLEHGEPALIHDTKSDIYALGVLFLELLTGRKPFDRLRPREERYLAEWASSRLHDQAYLEQMVDSGIKGTLSSRTLSQFADIISFCIQPEKEFRPTISEILESLTRMLPKAISTGSSADGNEYELYERSFRSTTTRFMASPAPSYISSDLSTG